VLDSNDPLEVILAPEHPVVFVDVSSQWEVLGKTSAAQAEVVRRLVLALRRRGVAAAEIGAIAPYRAQVAAIRQRLAARGEVEVAVDTVDRFQGGERQVILYSFGGRVEGVHATHHALGADFLADPHRLNVALTRAQRKLILAGDRRWLETKPLIGRLISYCAQLYDGRGGMISAHW
jgi:DNA replication ATP-dependent helicase Dna2